MIKATPRTARAINDRMALDLLVEMGPLTAPQLRELTGLSRPSVSDLVERLHDARLIEPAGETGADRRGPNARLWRVAAARAHVVGVDVRPGHVSAVCADLAGETVGEVELRGRPGIVAAVRAVARGPLHTVVVGAPGHGSRDGHAEQRELGARVVIENEVNLAAIAEHRAGAAVGRADFALLWLDSGTGGALVLDHKLRRGVSGAAGEVGFLPLRGGDLHDLVFGAPVDVLAERVALGVAAIVEVVDPGLVVLGGGVGHRGGSELAVRVQHAVEEICPVPVEVAASTVADNPVLLGATLLALDAARDETFG
ncbi:ROK family transcriptional regulator [Herbidospora sp. NBRC 101105]|uniref:ROK family transcriptional regulator n=1 Tax=Herbidospora sp. NBRC 101105 TaxID=3032195 RepID=UPI0024A28776|nr:ROK family transcriptional regulator [Herbidospora sp. NBRC 101105]GLX98030.1 transcriptional regulator [Herbidospora sp. NBRC 101105]